MEIEIKETRNISGNIFNNLKKKDQSNVKGGPYGTTG
jgi:hypothetical protein